MAYCIIQPGHRSQEGREYKNKVQPLGFGGRVNQQQLDRT